MVVKVSFAMALMANRSGVSVVLFGGNRGRVYDGGDVLYS